jgi:periplasmic protein CpxP/Spy
MIMKFINLKKQHILITAGLALCLAVTASQTLAEPIPSQHSRCKEGNHKPMPPMAENMMMPMPPYLRGIDNLSESQKDQIFNITYEQLPKFRNAEKQRHEASSALKEIAASSPYDDAKAQSLAAKLAELDKDLTLLRIRTDAKIFSLLTSEQKLQLEKFKEEFDRAPHMAPPFFPTNNKHIPNTNLIKTM